MTKSKSSEGSVHVLAPNGYEQRLNGIAISRGGCDIPGREHMPVMAARARSLCAGHAGRRAT